MAENEEKSQQGAARRLVEIDVSQMSPLEFAYSLMAEAAKAQTTKERYVATKQAAIILSGYASKDAAKTAEVTTALKLVQTPLRFASCESPGPSEKAPVGAKIWKVPTTSDSNQKTTINLIQYSGENIQADVENIVYGVALEKVDEGLQKIHTIVASKIDLTSPLVAMPDIIGDDEALALDDAASLFEPPKPGQYVQKIPEEEKHDGPK